MAAEATISGSIKFSKGTAPGTLNISRSNAAQSVDVAGTTGIHNVISVGTGDETLDLGDVGTIGFVWFKNLDGSNYVSVGPDGSSYPIKLKAGEFAGPLRWDGAAIHAKANSGACNFEYVVLPD